MDTPINSTALNIISHGISDRGVARTDNEDAFWGSDEFQVYAIADGLGGLPHGEVASTQAVSIVEGAVIENPESDISKLFHIINEQIIRRGAELEPNGLGMATTLTVGRVRNDDLEIFHAGDTGVFVYRDYQLTQLTEDHTMDGDYRKKMDLDKSAILPEYYKNILTQCLGIAPAVEASIYHFKLQKGDKILFFSDGLTKVIDEETLCIQMQDAATPQVLANALVRLSNLKGAPDNVTVIALYVQ